MSKGAARSKVLSRFGGLPCSAVLGRGEASCRQNVGSEDHCRATAGGGPRPCARLFSRGLLHLSRDEREVGLELLARCPRRGGETLLCDKGYAGREFAAAVAELGATVVRPKRADEPGLGPHLAPIRQRIESIFWTCKDLLTLERHGARTMAGLRERVLSRFLCLAACISLDHRLGRPSRALVDYCA